MKNSQEGPPPPEDDPFLGTLYRGLQLMLGMGAGVSAITGVHGTWEKIVGENPDTLVNIVGSSVVTAAMGVLAVGAISDVLVNKEIFGMKVFKVLHKTLLDSVFRK